MPYRSASYTDGVGTGNFSRNIRRRKSNSVPSNTEEGPVTSISQTNLSLSLPLKRRLQACRPTTARSCAALRDQSLYKVTVLRLRRQGWPNIPDVALSVISPVRAQTDSRGGPVFMHTSCLRANENLIMSLHGAGKKDQLR
jgi:hypothetical protein